MANTPLTYKGVPIVFDGTERFDALKEPPKLLSDDYFNKFYKQIVDEMSVRPRRSTWEALRPYRPGEKVKTGSDIYYVGSDGVHSVTVDRIRGKRADGIIIDDPYNDEARNLRPAEYRWGQWNAGIGVNAAEIDRTQISAEEALNLGLDIRKLVRVSPESNFYYKPPKEYPVTKVKKVKPVEYNTVGVRFLDGGNLAKVYTYRVPKKAKLHLGQEVIVPTDKTGSGYVTSSVGVIVRFDKEKQDTFGYDYKFVIGTVKPL